MTREIPNKLCNPYYRFFRALPNKKHPHEPAWNIDGTEHCYIYSDSDLRAHIEAGGNVGICSGYGRLIVVDFDDRVYMKQKLPLLPETFMVESAGRRMPHLYYHLEGEMIRKTGRDACPDCRRPDMLSAPKRMPDMRLVWLCSNCERHVEKARMVDIQAAGSGVMIPPSEIKGRKYTVIKDIPIATITTASLNAAFGIGEMKSARQKGEKNGVQPQLIQESINALLKVGILRTGHRHFRCPFHAMNGGGNLWVGDDGSIHCFHCGHHSNSASHFLKQWKK